MTRFLSAVARLLRDHDAEPAPHLHQSAHGVAMPAVCYDRGCRYPRLDA